MDGDVWGARTRKGLCGIGQNGSHLWMKQVNGIRIVYVSVAYENKVCGKRT
ncbi:MAG: hypothetical protein FWD76_00605 [Firmicutes bacterium]|nr:hypothetical protein [Bacillota bacterium]